jgi:hypothetical protein
MKAAEMKSFAIDPQSNTFSRQNGRMRYTRNELEHLCQVIRHEISLFYGEWFMDSSKGIPYFPTSDSKSEHRIILETALRTKVSGIKGVKRIIYFRSALDRSTRLFRVDFAVMSEYGEFESSWTNRTGAN